MKRIVTIAGSDTLSGGGLQADLRTFQEYNIIGSNVLTCIVTVEANTDIVKINELPLPIIKQELNDCLSDEVTIDGIKIGMLANIEIAKMVAKVLKTKQNVPIVLDPVLALKESGMKVKEDITSFFLHELMPVATITTPNLREAELLSGMDNITTVNQMKEAAKKIQSFGVKNVVVKGGQRIRGDRAIDVLYDGTKWVEFEQPKLENGYNNGAGCTFASAITANIASGKTVEESVYDAKQFVYRAIENGIPFLPGLGNVWQGK